MTLDRRSFLATGGLVTAGGAALGTPALAAPQAGVDGSRSAALFLKDDDGLAPATLDRLPLEWHQARAKALQAHLAENGFDGVWLTDPMNIIYFTGLFFTTTERPFSVFIPADKLATIWFHPGLDRDLVRSWWATDADYYFDFQHADGAYPNEGKVQQGAKVDLFEWVLHGLKKRGYDGKRIATDRDLSPRQLSKAATVFLKDTKFESVAEHCEKLRMVKSPEELALWRRAYRVFDETHAFARDLLLAKGTDLTDYQLGTAAQEFGMGRLMSGIKRDGKPHTAVGIAVEVEVRCGVGTAYPHPNQTHYNRIQKGQALQIAGGVSIGGCGGELYRAFLIAPWTDHQKKVWTVSRDCCLMQKDLSREGVACSTVAYEIHKHQVKEGTAKYIYHRPAHGMGVEGHQPPYIALGDYTMLEAGMIFSVEPGLYDPENGFGVNFSDGFAVQPGGKASLQMSRLPWSEDWCLVKL
ncbi:MAG TPA: M24 family metallopeptidase [Thermoanaerobaculia bacterium]|jgi:Xaa-Pro aminopeptidase|nr:M24 family metallopeptidase [Thermoanaerobaculia bacterium]